MSGRFPAYSALRRRLPTVLATLVVAGVLAFLTAVSVLWFGLYDVGATSKHAYPVEWLLHFAMQRSVAAHAPELTVPDLDNPNLILRGIVVVAQKPNGRQKGIPPAGRVLF